MDTYAVQVNREDGLWSAIVDDLPDGVFLGLDFERFAEVDDGVRKALVDLFGHEDFELEWMFTTPRDDVTAW